MDIGVFKVFSLIIFDSVTSSLNYEILWKISQILKHLTRFEEFLMGLCQAHCKLYLTVV